jgi:adenosine deaminase CECR1
VAPDAAFTAFATEFEAFKRTATDEQLYRFLYAMPKGGDLHHHLGGGFLPQRWFAIATDPTRNGGQTFYTRYRLTAPPSVFQPEWETAHNLYFWMTIHENAYRALPAAAQADFKPLADLSATEKAAWISSVVLDRKGEGRDEFFEYTWGRLNHLLFSIHVNAELVVENMAAFGAEGVRYLELMTFYAIWKDEKGEVMPVEAANAFWQRRLSQPDALATGVKVRFKAVVLRFADNAEEMTEAHFKFLDAHRDLWVGLDMAGREDDNRGFPKRFTEVFDRMHAKYPDIPISIHAGESEKPDRHIFDTLRLGADRIGHAINLIRDAQTFQMMRNGKHLLEINLVSNHLLGYVPDTAKHPFPIYFRQGIPCCLNTDDRGMWDSNMTDEYFLAVKHFNLSWAELCDLGQNSLSFAFLPAAERSALLADWESALAKFMAAKPCQNADRLAATTYGYGRRTLGLTKLAEEPPTSGEMRIVPGLSAV